jgi:8-amino-7-oxononanoate synthase
VNASYVARVRERLAQIEAQHRTRAVQPHQPSAAAIDFSSNDYLALSRDPQVVQAFRHATRVGSGGARLLGGRHREHSLLEEELAAWLGRERAVLFSSGYLAALGAVSVLADVSEVVYSDALNHASLVDGVRSARKTPRHVYAHAALPPRTERESDALIASESLFSMDGDTIDAAHLLRDLGDGDVLLLDEAHALGVYGPQGAGLAFGLDDPRVVVLGTLSKSLGALGGFVAGPAETIELIVNAARTFVFDTALPPAVALAARVALSIARKGDERRARLRSNAVRLRAGLEAIGLDLPGDDASQIVPIVLGDEERAMRVSAQLLEKNLYVPAVRPPTVPVGTSRLRASVRADHEPEHIDLLVREVARCIATS